MTVIPDRPRRRTGLAGIAAGIGLLALAAALVPLFSAHAAVGPSITVSPASGNPSTVLTSVDISLPGCTETNSPAGPPGAEGAVYIVQSGVTTPLSTDAAAAIEDAQFNQGTYIGSAVGLVDSNSQPVDEVSSADLVSNMSSFAYSQLKAGNPGYAAPGEYTLVAICANSNIFGTPPNDPSAFVGDPAAPGDVIAATARLTLNADDSWFVGDPPTDSGTPTDSSTPTESSTPTDSAGPSDTPSDTPSVSLSDGGTVTPGSAYQLTFAAGTFGGGDKVDVELHSAPTSLGTVTAATDGGLSFTLTSAVTSGLAAGSSHQLVFTSQADPTKTQTVAFTVADGSSAPASTGSNPASTFLTDSTAWATAPQGIATLAGIAVVLAIGIVGAWGWFWRRRRQQTLSADER